MRSFKVQNSIISRKFIEQCNHHHNIIIEYFHHSKKETFYPFAAIPQSPSLAWGTWTQMFKSHCRLRKSECLGMWSSHVYILTDPQVIQLWPRFDNHLNIRRKYLNCLERKESKRVTKFWFYNRLFTQVKSTKIIPEKIFLIQL